MRIVFFSDLHLDTTFLWMGSSASRIFRQQLRETLRRIVDLAEEVDAETIFCGGDLYEHERFSPDTSAFLQDTFSGTSRRVFLAPGNHDWLGSQSIYRQVSWPGNVTIFEADRLTPHELSPGLTLWGAAHHVPAGTGGFLENFRVDRDGIHLALFHGSENGQFRFQGDEKEPHAPFAASQIPAAGLHHAFVGHYHRPSDAEHHTYPGNPHPLTFGEDGDRGVVVADIQDDGKVERERKLVSRSCLHDVTLDVTGSTSFTDIRTRASDALTGLEGAARITVTGSLSPDVDLRLSDLENLDTGLLATTVRARNLQVAYDLDAIAKEPTIRGQFIQDVRDAPDLSEEERRRIIITGLRALDGRPDLEVP